MFKNKSLVAWHVFLQSPTQLFCLVLVPLPHSPPLFFPKIVPLSRYSKTKLLYKPHSHYQNTALSMQSSWVSHSIQNTTHSEQTNTTEAGPWKLEETISKEADMEMHGIVDNKFPVTKSILIYVHTHHHQKAIFWDVFNVTAKGKNSKRDKIQIESWMYLSCKIWLFCEVNTNLSNFFCHANFLNY